MLNQYFELKFSLNGYFDFEFIFRSNPCGHVGYIFDLNLIPLDILNLDFIFKSNPFEHFRSKFKSKFVFSYDTFRHAR